MLLSALRDNLRLAVSFSASPRLRVPVLLLWVAVFGGSLHAPCTTYFMLSVGGDGSGQTFLSALVVG